MATKTKDETSTNLMKATPQEIELAYRAISDGDVLPEVGDPEAVSRAIMERIRRAESFEEAFAAQKVTPWRQLLDLPVFIKSFHLNRSTLERQDGQPSVYAIVDIQRADGEPWTSSGREESTLTVSCGGRNVLFQLVRALEMDWFKYPMKLTSKKSSEGFDVLWLEDARSSSA